jgi:PAS domain S-box-containing protein
MGLPLDQPVLASARLRRGPIRTSSSGGGPRGTPTLSFGRAAAASAAIVAVLGGLLVLQPFGDRASSVVGNSGYLLGAGLGFVFALAGARRRHGRARLPWLCVAGAQLCWLVANGYWMTFEWVRANPLPFWSPYDLGAFGDVVYLTASALLIAAVGVLLRGAVAAASPLRLVLDSLLVAASLFYVTWALLLRDLPALGWDVDRAVTWAYPVFDVGLAAVAVIALSRTGGRNRWCWLLLAGAMVILAAGDVFWAYANLTGAFQAGLPIDVVWVAGYLTVGLAALVETDDEMLPASVSSRWTAFVPYVPLLLVLVIALARLGKERDSVLIVTALAAVGFLLVRQIVAVLENQKLARELESAVLARTADLAKLAAIVEVGRDAMVTLAVPDRAVLTWNPAAESIFGYSSAEMIGHRVDVLFGGSNSDEVIQAHESWLHGRQSTPLELQLRRKDGQDAYTSTLSAPIHDEAGRVVAAAVVLRDVTTQRVVDEQVRQSQKLEAVGRLSAGIAHDFNNLLTVIGGYTDLALARAGESDPELRKDLMEIGRASQHAAGLTRQLLAFGRRQVLQPEALDLDGVVTEHASMLRRIIGEDIALHVELDARGGLVQADPGQLSQVLLNLAANARDAMPAGGDLSIRTRTVLLPDGDATVGLDRGRYVLLEVGDTGTGLADDARTHLFEPFFTTKEVGRGTGLGLSTVLGIVEQSNGRIAVESDRGAGTTFRIYLPLLEAAGVSAEHP